MEEFGRMRRLPPYVFATVNNLKMELRHKGEDIIDLGMGILTSLRLNIL